jgi:hypothetical protein
MENHFSVGFPPGQTRILGPGTWDSGCLFLTVVRGPGLEQSSQILGMSKELP